MARAVEEIARFEQRDPTQVLRDLGRPRADLLRFAVESRETGDGGIPLDDGFGLLAGSRKALLSAACSVERPQRFHPRMSLREADAFVRACRLGQTEHGSFVVTLECALDAEGEPSPLEGGREPFGRKVTSLLLSSLARLMTAIVTDGLRALTDPDAGDPVVSANLCEALPEMMPSTDDAALRVASSWSPVLPPPRGIPANFRLERQHSGAIERLARDLRPTASPAPDLFVGKVATLQGVPRPDGRMQGEAVLLAQVEGEILRIRFELGPDDYKAACDAHRDGQYVSARGILRRGARVHRLEGAEGFAVVRG
jgi:hypothetical protein